MQKRIAVKSASSVSSERKSEMTAPGIGPHEAAHERELIQLCLAGDARAESEFVCRYGRVVDAVLRKMNLPDAEREDTFQEVFLHLWKDDRRRLRQWQGRVGGKFSSYLAVITTRIALDHLRYNTRRRRSPVGENSQSLDDLAGAPSTQTDIFEEFHRKEQVLAIRRYLPTLSDRDATILKRRHLYGQTYREMAQGMGLTISHVGVVLARAEEHLRQALCLSHPELFSDDAASGRQRSVFNGVRHT